jgi:dihydroorotate dehydrogenase
MHHRIRPLLFRLDAEQAHGLTLKLLKWAGDIVVTRTLLQRWFTIEDLRLHTEAFGLHFKNRVGLAAGYDKNGVAVPGLSALGFGHIEVGTVTRHMQPGNDKPRLWRAPAAQAIINSMGFPNAGVDACHPMPMAGVRLGINIGKSKETPVERAAEDYCILLQQVYRRADYVTINVSSPNTLNLRQLQARAAIEDLLRAVTAVRAGQAQQLPLLVKIAPDLTDSALDDILAAVTVTGIDGVIATNTTTSRAGLPPAYQTLPGGVSGEPLRARSTEIVRAIAQRTGGRLPIIGVGGIMTPAGALEKLDAGAWLVQLYTGLVYTGPGLVRAINLSILGRTPNPVGASR